MASSTDIADTSLAGPAAESVVPFTKKVLYGSGSFAEFTWQWSVQSLAMPIYNVCFGVNPALVGLVLGVARIWDAITDPIMGSISDNSRSKWGRRRPFIFAGAIASGLTYALLWMAPRGMPQWAYVAFFLVASLLFYSAYTVFSVPFYAFGYEMSDDPRERTRVMGSRIIGNSLCGLLVAPWIYWLAQRNLFSDTIQGIRCVGLATGLVMMGFALVPALFLRDQTQARVAHQEQVSIWASLRYSLTCRPYLILIGGFASALLLFAMVSQINFYLAAFYVFQGDTARASLWIGWAQAVQHIVVIVFAPWLARLANRWGKKKTCITFLSCIAIGALMNFFAYQRDMPWLMIFPPFVMMFGWASLWMFVPSMIADVTDWDELQHGLRREGMFGAIHCWVVKMAFSFGALCSGVLINLTGFQIKLAEAGAAQPEGTFSRMLLLAALFPAVGVGGAMLLLSRFPLTEAAMVRVKAQLRERHASGDELDGESH